MSGFKLDITGQTFGHLTARSFDSEVGKWLCDCVCGKAHLAAGAYLRAGRIASCGCLSSRASTIHGEGSPATRTKEYRAWHSMAQRCFNPNEKRFPGYGGRGITVCERWRHNYPAFLADMGRAPSPKHSLDRIDVNGNYEPKNCRWATASEQQRNRRDNWYIDGEYLADFCERRGLNYESVRSKLRRGLPSQEAIRDQRAAKKLTPDQVAAIRDDARPPRAVAEDFGVCRTTIVSIREGRTWRHA